jgi:predicted NBD/HSP70 family sugar kinase
VGIVEAANRDSVRRRNLSSLLAHVHRAGQISRSSLTAATGLNRSTVGALVTDLAARGLLEEGEPVGRGTPGRPSPQVRPRPGGVVVLAAEVEVSTISFAVAGLGGVLHEQVRVDRAAHRRTPEATVEDLVALIDDATARLAPDRPVLGLGVAVAGIVRRDDGFVHVAPNLEWHDVPLGEMLADRLGNQTPVSMGNDADLGAMAEHMRGAGVGVDNLIYVASEVGVGGGIIIGGRPLTGAAGYAGEIGHIAVNPDGAECRCGARGCLEAETGEWALLRHVGRARTNEREAVDEVLREAAIGDAGALRALETIGGWLGVGLADLVNIFNPNRLVLGGMFAKAHPYISAALQRELDQRVQGPSRSMVTVLPTTLGEDSTLIGAVELAFEPLLADPTIIPVADGATVPPDEDRRAG